MIHLVELISEYQIPCSVFGKLFSPRLNSAKSPANLISSGNSFHILTAAFFCLKQNLVYLA